MSKVDANCVKLIVRKSLYVPRFGIMLLLI